MTARHDRIRRLSRVPLALLAITVAVSTTAGALAAGSRASAPGPLSGPGVGNELRQLVHRYGFGGPVDTAPPASPLAAVAEHTAVHTSPSPAELAAAKAQLAPPVPAAPPGYAGSLVKLYDSAMNLNVQAGGDPAQAASAKARFAASVGTLTSADLGRIYDATLKVPGSGAVPDVVAAVSASLSGDTGALVPLTRVARAAGAGGTTSGPAAHAAPAPHTVGTGVTFPSATYSTIDPSQNPSNCPVPAGPNYGETDIFAIQLTIDTYTEILAAIPQDLVVGTYEFAAGETITLPDPAWAIANAALLALEIARDTLIYKKAIASDCNGNSMNAYDDNVFANVQSLIQLVDQRTDAISEEDQLLYVLVDERNTLILNELKQLQASLEIQLRVTIESSLLAGGPGTADFQLPASQGGFLDAQPVGIQSVVNDAISQSMADHQATNPSAARDFALANEALAGGRYKSAYDLYGQAYREAVQF